MRPIEFVGANVVFGANQPQYNPLPAARQPGDPSGRVTTCWELTDEELDAIVLTRKVWVQVLTFGQPIQPQVVAVDAPSEFPFALQLDAAVPPCDEEQHEGDTEEQHEGDTDNCPACNRWRA